MALALAACAAAGGPAAAEVRFPEDSGVIDVTRPPYNARGDGQSDDTAAIQQALLDHPDRNAVIYLPTGTYRISQTLKWPWTEGIDGRQRATILQGQSRTGTVIRLGDRTPAFGSGSRGHPMLWMGQELSTHARNAIRDLTVDIGIGNPGATGIRLMANHQGGLRNVTVRAPDPTQGVVGIDLAHAEIVGPCLLRDVAVEGFEYGIQAAYSLNSVTLEHVMLTGQRMAAVRNSGQTLTFRDLQTRGEGPAIQSTDRTGFVTVVGGRFEGLPTRRPSPAVLNRAFLFLQDVTTPGYTNAVQAPSRDREGAAGPEVPLYLSHDAFNLHPAPHLPIGLEVRETPAPDWDPPSGWASPLAHGGRPDDTGDDTAAIQAAIDSGATTVYLPNGTWNVRSTIEIRGRVHRVVGCEARINNDGMRGQPVFRVGPEGAPRVHVERLEVVPGYDPLVEQAGDRTLVLSACHQAALTCSGRGDLFIEDVSSLRPCEIRGNRVWARQWNFELDGTKITNDGGTLWVLGLMASRPGTLIDTRNGGRTELLGALCVASGGFKAAPLLRLNESEGSFVLGEASFFTNPFQLVVEETRGGVVRRLRSTGPTPDRPLPTRLGGVGLTLYSGYDGPGAVPPAGAGDPVRP